jgi:GTP-binding protein Era
VDIIMLVVDLVKYNDPEIPVILKNVDEAGKPCVLVINKIDLLPKDAVLPVIKKFSNEHSFRSIIPVSAQKGDGIDLIVGDLKKMLRPGPAFFPEDMKSDQPEEFLVSEVIREKIYFLTRKELPYSSAVTVTRIEQAPEKALVSIAASIHVESESQKAIMIGHKGKMISDIGRSSRLELEKILRTHVYLDLVVKVDKNWSKDTRALRRLGY